MLWCVFVCGLCGVVGELVGLASGFSGATSWKVAGNLYFTASILLCLSQMRGFTLVPHPLSSIKYKRVFDRHTNMKLDASMTPHIDQEANKDLSGE